MAKNDHKREKIEKTHQNRQISSIFGLISQSGGQKQKKTVTDANQKRLKQNPQLTSILRLITLIKAE